MFDYYFLVSVYYISLYLNYVWLLLLVCLDYNISFLLIF